VGCNSTYKTLASATAPINKVVQKANRTCLPWVIFKIVLIIPDNRPYIMAAKK
jgi:hypothetical protein